MLNICVFPAWRTPCDHQLFNLWPKQYIGINIVCLLPALMLPKSMFLPRLLSPSPLPFCCLPFSCPPFSSPLSPSHPSSPLVALPSPLSFPSLLPPRQKVDRHCFVYVSASRLGQTLTGSQNFLSCTVLHVSTLCLPNVTSHHHTYWDLPSLPLLYYNLMKIGSPSEICPAPLLNKAIAFLLKVLPLVYAAVHVGKSI